MSAKPRDLTGQRFGRLVALAPTPKRVLRNIVWAFRCDCGAEIERASGEVTRGTISSCGCYRVDSSRERATAQRIASNKALATHGMSRTPTFNVWSNMHQRCKNPKHKSYHRYGGRGITVDPRWDSFENFLADMGEQPKGMQLDREKNHLGYQPGNVTWATPKQNGNNRDNNHRITHAGRTLNIKEWAAEKGMNHQTIAHRLKAGWGVSDALETPAGARR